MTLRTLPNQFPSLYQREGYTRKSAKSSLARKIAISQNYLWARLRRVYAMGGSEGHGNVMYHIDANYPQHWDGEEKLTMGAVGSHIMGVPIVSFLVPPNWCASSRVLIQGLFSFATKSTSTAWIVAQLCDLDGKEVSETTFEIKAADEGTDKTWSIEVQVPQDNVYQIRVFLAFIDASTEVESVSESKDTTDWMTFGANGEGMKVSHVSARYAVGNTSDLGGDTVPTTWAPTADFYRADYPLSSAFIERLIKNTQHLYAMRPPELCQVWLDKPYNNTSAFVEVGRYRIWTPSRVTQLTGKLVTYCTNGGAGNEVRVKLNGSVVQTFTALASGETISSVTAFTVTDNQENVITIEAKSTAASADWGTMVWGVSMWESSTTLSLPGGTSVPSFYTPLDEEALEGDDIITAEVNNAFGQRAGWRTMFDNDRWLAFNRLRHVIGDWRHRVLKRGTLSPNTSAEPRVDWTPGPFTSGLPDNAANPKNITIRGATSTENDKDGYAKFATGLPTSETGDQLAASVGSTYAAAWSYPTDLQFTLHGRRLGFWQLVNPSGVRTLPKDANQLRIYMRARRLRVQQMATGSDGFGPGDGEIHYIGKAYLEFLLDSSVTQMNVEPPDTYKAGQVLAPLDTFPSWLPSTVVTCSASDQTLKVRGRLPPQAAPISGIALWQTSHAYTAGAQVKDPNGIYRCTTGGTSSGSGTGPSGTGSGITDGSCVWLYVMPFSGVPEGMYFEVELLSYFIADEPLAASLLALL